MKIINQPFASSVATRNQDAFNKYTRYNTGLPKAPSTKASGVAAEVEISQEAKSLYNKLQEGGK